jgi:S-adenosylmethionine:tRNA ribosyltransferase-isomerase
VQLSDIDYELPEELIAQKPVEPRDSARLLVSTSQAEVQHLHVSDFDSLVGPGDVLVVNDTRVLPARIHLQRRTGGAAEVLLLEQKSEDHRHWEAMVKPARKLKEGEILEYFGKRVVRIGARTESGDTFNVEILDDDPMGLLQRIGTMPLPPYIRGSLTDKERYQTIYARRAASAAAPTAGLHFTPELLARIEAKGVKVVHVELIVGLDTFKPISAENPLDHVIHTEYYNVSQEVLDTCGTADRVIAVGTTATRALESALTRGELSGRTNLFITPGYEWKIVDAMLTNFHLPRTSLLLMVESFIGAKWRELYASAIEEKYRFLSFGDAMFIEREGK